MTRNLSLNNLLDQSKILEMSISRLAKFGRYFVFTTLVFSSTTLLAKTAIAGDPDKYSTTPGNPSCKWFDGFTINGNGTVTDPRNGLVWQQCSIGMTWNGNTCTGSAKEMNWISAIREAKGNRFLGNSNWRLPSKEELESITGRYHFGCKDNDPNLGQLAYSPVLKRSGGYQIFWSFTKREMYINTFWAVYFNDGNVSSSGVNEKNSVRLVRASSSSGGTVALAKADREFNVLYEKEVPESATNTQRELNKAQRQRDDAAEVQRRNKMYD